MMNGQKKANGALALTQRPCVVTIPANTTELATKLRVAAYARVSSNSEDQLNSYAAQNAHYTELITSNPEWEFVDVYADKGITGTSTEKREDFQRLLADCRRGRIDKILVKSSSRFARNAKECLEAVRELKALDVSVCFEEQNIDTAELSGELLVAIFAMMDQKESETISQNMRWSYQVYCNICGNTFKRKQCHNSIYWVCSTHESDPSKCLVTQIIEKNITDAFFRMYFKLRHRGKNLLYELTTNLRTARQGKMLWNSDIVELNMQIADITRQDRLLAQLKQQGLVDPDLFISRRDALAEQLRAVKLEKERLLKSEENPTISQTRVLLETLEAAPEFLDTFDEELFREIVDKIIVESNERLRFRLINGLELTEDIERTVR